MKFVSIGLKLCIMQSSYVLFSETEVMYYAVQLCIILSNMGIEYFSYKMMVWNVNVMIIALNNSEIWVLNVTCFKMTIVILHSTVLFSEQVWNIIWTTGKVAGPWVVADSVL